MALSSTDTLHWWSEIAKWSLLWWVLTSYFCTLTEDAFTILHACLHLFQNELVSQLWIMILRSLKMSIRFWSGKALLGSQIGLVTWQVRRNLWSEKSPKIWIKSIHCWLSSVTTFYRLHFWLDSYIPKSNTINLANGHRFPTSMLRCIGSLCFEGIFVRSRS